MSRNAFGQSEAGRCEAFSGKVSRLESRDEKRPSAERRNDSPGRFERSGEGLGKSMPKACQICLLTKDMLYM